ncbi:MAG: hypothetical protein A2X49_16840 [Lentisphaerae bacterium GWF2_52_8]|nr:MAG: hypothetical protein A2X49_16840 [Lentisphaerae bacterium GWF2_52_8]
MNRAVFLDRDGTINIDYGYISDEGDISYFPDVFSSLLRLQTGGFKLIVVSNQGGIALGYLDPETSGRINKRVVSDFAREGIIISGVYTCPHHPRGGAKWNDPDCRCRKPRPGMLKDAAAEHDIDLKASFMVGDKITDVGAGRNAGCSTVLVLTGQGKQALSERQSWEYLPDFIADNLKEAADHILGES